MLALVFHVGPHRYALDARQIREVLPLVEIRPIPLAPAGVAGVFSYRGAPIPAIDLSVLMLGSPAPSRLSTRLLIVDHPGGAAGVHPLGLIAERATRVVRWSEADFVETGVSGGEAPFLGPLASDEGHLVQRVDVSRLLPPDVCDRLFTRPLPHGHASAAV